MLPMLCILALAIVVSANEGSNNRTNTTKANPIYASTANDAARIALFSEWFRREYGAPLGLEVRASLDAGGGFGVYATESIARETPYLRIPRRLLMSDTTLQEHNPALWTAVRHLDRMLRVALFLMHERFVRRKRSFFHPYINTIPHVMDTPQYYTHTELKELEGSGVPELVKREKQQWRQQHSQLNATLFRKNPALFPARAFGSLTRFRWAKSILATRSIWVGGMPCLVPFLDMVNCAEQPAHLGAGGGRVHRTHAEGAYATTYAPWAFPRDSQVFENYGQKNYIYFLHHGFSVPDNHHDCIDLANFIAWPQDKAARTAITKLKLREAIEQGGACVSGRGVPTPLQQVMRVLAVVGEGGGGGGWETAMRAQLPSADEKRVWEGVMGLLHRFLEKFPTTPQYDKALMQDETLPFRKRMSVQFRLEQKKTAIAAVQWVDAQIQALRVVE